TPDLSNIPSGTNQPIHRKGFAVPAADMTAEEKAALAKKFKDKFKPALTKWSNAYAGHIPFDPEEVTLDKFHSVLGQNLYTFMVNGITLTFQDDRDVA